MEYNVKTSARSDMTFVSMASANLWKVLLECRFFSDPETRVRARTRNANKNMQQDAQSLDSWYLRVFNHIHCSIIVGVQNMQKNTVMDAPFVSLEKLWLPAEQDGCDNETLPPTQPEAECRVRCALFFLSMFKGRRGSLLQKNGWLALLDTLAGWFLNACAFMSLRSMISVMDAFARSCFQHLMLSKSLSLSPRWFRYISLPQVFFALDALARSCHVSLVTSPSLALHLSPTCVLC